MRVGGDGCEILLDVPGAAGFGIAQAAHDFEQALDACVWVVDQIIGHCGKPSCRVTST